MFVSTDLIEVRLGHKLGNRLVEENKIMQMIVVGVKSLLVIEPINSIRSDACLTWNLKLSAIVGRSIKCVDTQNFSTSVRRHNWNTRSEVSQIFLLVCFASRSWIVHVPHIIVIPIDITVHTAH